MSTRKKGTKERKICFVTHWLTHARANTIASHCIQCIACFFQGNGKAKMYIMTLGVLAPYRDLGVGKFAISKLFRDCALIVSARFASFHSALCSLRRNAVA